MTQSSVLSPAQRLLTVGLLGLMTAVAFEGLAIPTIMPATVDELGGIELYGWAFSAFFLTNIVGVTLAGADADRRGPGRSFVSGVGLFAAGLLISGLAPSMPIVIAGRAVQGLGAGAIGAIVFAVIARAYLPAAMPRMVALLSSAWVVPGLVGPALAGLIAEHLDWRWVFLALIPAVLLMGTAVVRPIARLGPPAFPPRAASGRRGIAALALAAGSALLLAGLSVAQIAIALTLVLAGGWLAVTAVRRLLPAGALRAAAGRPAVFALIFLVAFGFFGTETFVPLAVTSVRGSTTTIGGLALSAAAVTWAIGSWLPARLVDVSRGRIVGLGSAAIAAGIAVTALVVLPAPPIAIAAVGWAIAGLGMGFAYSTLMLLVLQTAPPGEEGASSAGAQLMFTLGTALGAGTAGAIVAVADVSDLPLAAAIAAADVLMLLVVGVGLLIALAGRLPTGREAAARSTPEAGSGVASPA
ncbi:MAG TPA: MFS transporter, partial [Candidatus Limnocylindria bacterium]|nr:MFS transporter [Candidatus Limnocylindria bacterium]